MYIHAHVLSSVISFYEGGEPKWMNLFYMHVLSSPISFYEGEEPPGEGDAAGDQRNLPDFLPGRTHLLADQ